MLILISVLTGLFIGGLFIVGMHFYANDDTENTGRVLMYIASTLIAIVAVTCILTQLIA